MILMKRRKLLGRVYHLEYIGLDGFLKYRRQVSRAASALGRWYQPFQK